MGRPLRDGDVVTFSPELVALGLPACAKLRELAKSGAIVGRSLDDHEVKLSNAELVKVATRSFPRG